MERMTQWITRMRRIPPERFVILLLALVAAGLWLWVSRVWPRPLEVTALAVGDGDALLVRAPSGRTVLIDGGTRGSAEVGDRVLVPNLHLLGVRRLDAILITHPDSDHINGLPAVLRALPVGRLLDPGLPCDTASYQALLKTAQARHVPRVLARDGMALHLGGGVTLALLAPCEPFILDNEDNNNSVVSLLQYRQARMLFTGDLEREGEQALLDRGADLHADVLKVAHHGSQNGTSEALLDAVDPALAVISTRGDRTRSLAPVLGRLRARGVQVLRTDAQGQLRLSTDGTRWRIRTYRNPAAGE
jgi:competence protein ComEC